MLGVEENFHFVALIPSWGSPFLRTRDPDQYSKSRAQRTPDRKLYGSNPEKRTAFCPPERSKSRCKFLRAQREPRQAWVLTSRHRQPVQLCRIMPLPPDSVTALRGGTSLKRLSTITCEKQEGFGSSEPDLFMRGRFPCQREVLQPHRDVD